MHEMFIQHGVDPDPALLNGLAPPMLPILKQTAKSETGTLLQKHYVSAENSIQRRE